MEDRATLGHRLRVVFIRATWGIRYRDSYQINCLNINNWSDTANALDYWTSDIVYITLCINWKNACHYEMGIYSLRPTRVE
jgi:hypothetical protein